MKSCTVGQRVESEGKTGTVVRFDPGHDNQAWCYVDEDGGGKNVAYPSWMLTDAGAAAQATASIKPGHYECWGQGGASASAACSSRAGGCVSMHYMYQDINVSGGGSYTDKQGRGGRLSYNSGSRMISFASGPYAGWSAKYLAGGKIGLSVKPTNFWSIICDWKR
jgi:hypothetical protein